MFFFFWQYFLAVNTEGEGESWLPWLQHCLSRRRKKAAEETERFQ